jgi:hypothetical protein
MLLAFKCAIDDFLVVEFNIIRLQEKTVSGDSMVSAELERQTQLVETLNSELEKQTKLVEKLKAQLEKQDKEFTELKKHNSNKNIKQRIDLLSQKSVDSKSFAYDRLDVQPANDTPKTIYMSKLEEFENEQKTKKQELQNKLKKEKMEKERRDKVESIRIENQRKLEMEETATLTRIINMFNSQATGIFEYGGISTYANGMNQWSSTSYTLTNKERKKYTFTIRTIKHIKSINGKLLTTKHQKLIEDYSSTKKYVIGTDSNPLVEFAFYELIENNSYLENIMKMLKDVQKQIDHLKTVCNPYASNCYSNIHQLDNEKKELSAKISKINEIKNKKLKTKEYYIANHAEFCEDFNIKNKPINYDVLNKEWNILQHWVKSKQQMFNNLIKNIFDICDAGNDGINFVQVEDINANCYSTHKTPRLIHILDGYTNYIKLSTQSSRTEQNNGVVEISHQDLMSDYKIEYFEPLFDLTKQFIELIDFVKETL